MFSRTLRMKAESSTTSTRHFEVGDPQVAAVLRDEFGGFQAVGGELHAIAVLFEHAADKLSNADGVVGDDDDALLIDAIDGFGGDGAAGDRRGARREHARRAGRGLQRPAFAGFGGHHAIQIDEKNQAAIGSDGGAGEKFNAAEICAEVLGDDLVLANDFLDDQADLAISGVGDNHAEISVDGLQRRQAQIGIEANDFGDDVADFSEEFSADVLAFIGAETPNSFVAAHRTPAAAA